MTQAKGALPKGMTVAEAAAQWEDAKRIIQQAEPKLNAAAKVLKEFFRKSGKADYKNRIGYAKTMPRRLDATRLRAELPDVAEAYTVPSERETLSLLT